VSSTVFASICTVRVKGKMLPLFEVLLDLSWGVVFIEATVIEPALQPTSFLFLASEFVESVSVMVKHLQVPITAVVNKSFLYFLCPFCSKSFHMNYVRSVCCCLCFWKLYVEFVRVVHLIYFV